MLVPSEQEGTKGMATDGWATLRHRDFALLCGARFSVTLALNIAQVAIGWYIYDITGSAFALAYLGLAGFFPAVILVMFTGYAADMIDRRLLLFAANSVLALTGVALLVAVSTWHGIVWPIYVIVICIASARSFFGTSIQALLPNLVPKDQLSSAVAFSSGAFQGATIAGPAIGGLLYALDARAPFIASAVFWALAAFAAYSIRYRSKRGDKRPPVNLTSLLAGFEFAWSKKVVFGAITLDALVVLLGNIVILLPIFAKDVLDVGPVGLGLLRSAPAVGAFAMAVWLARNSFVQRRAGPKLLQTVAIFGLASAVFAFSENLYLSLAALVIVGASDMVSVVIRHTLVQAETPDDVRGRVASVNSLFASSSSELGQFRSGVIAGFFGPVVSAATGGLGVLALVVVWPFLFRELAKRDYLVEEQPKEVIRV
ncbi:MAG: hypothetical protein RLZ98_1899 [Pseudomonadota bacterium]|jgi:MFS family permease